ncbi:hypothetical protein D3C71_1302530 [compost metagenome]
MPHGVDQVVDMQIRLLLRTVPENLQLLGGCLQLADEIEDHAVRRGHADDVRESEDVCAREECLDGRPDLRFRCQLHGPVVGNRLQRADVLVDFALAEIAVDGRTRCEVQLGNVMPAHRLEHGKGGQERAIAVDARIGHPGRDVRIGGQVPDMRHRGTSLADRCRQGFQIGAVHLLETETGLAVEFRHQLTPSTRQVIQGQNSVTFFKQTARQIDGDKTSATSDQVQFHGDLTIRRPTSSWKLLAQAGMSAART